MFHREQRRINSAFWQESQWELQKQQKLKSHFIFAEFSKPLSANELLEDLGKQSNSTGAGCYRAVWHDQLTSSRPPRTVRTVRSGHETGCVRSACLERERSDALSHDPQLIYRWKTSWFPWQRGVSHLALADKIWEDLHKWNFALLVTGRRNVLYKCDSVPKKAAFPKAMKL